MKDSASAPVEPAPAPRWLRHWPVVLAVVLLLAQVLPLIELRSLNRDEFNTTDIALFGATINPEQAPLYFWMMQAWCSLAGGSHLAVRGPSLLFGVLALLSFWRMWRRFSVLAVWLFPLAGLAPRIVEQCLNARVYTLFLWLSLEVLNSTLDILEDRPVRWWWATLCGAALMLSHTFGIIPAGVLGATAWLQMAGRRKVTPAALLMGLVFCGVLVERVLSLRSGIEFSEALRREDLGRPLFVYVYQFCAFLVGTSWLAWGVALLGSAGFVWLVGSTGWRGIALAVNACAGLSLVWYGWYHGYHRCTFRYSFFVLPLFLLGVGWVVGNMRSVWARAGLFLMVAAAFLHTNLNSTWTDRVADWRGAVRALEQVGSPEDVRAFFPAFMAGALTYYREQEQTITVIHGDNFEFDLENLQALAQIAPCPPVHVLLGVYHHGLFWNMQDTGYQIQVLRQFDDIDVLTLGCTATPVVPLLSPLPGGVLTELPEVSMEPVPGAVSYLVYASAPGNLTFRYPFPSSFVSFAELTGSMGAYIPDGPVRLQMFAVDSEGKVLTASEITECRLHRGWQMSTRPSLTE